MDTVEYDFKYKCEAGHDSIYEGHACDREMKTCLTPECKFLAEYQGFVPLKMGITGKISYDQNGRKAFRIHHQDGTVRHVSESKMRYLETGDLTPSYTKAYEEHLVSKGLSDQLVGQTQSEMQASRRATETFRKRLVPVTASEIETP